MKLRKVFTAMLCSLLVYSFVMAEDFSEPIPSRWQGPVKWQPHEVPVVTKANRVFEIREVSILADDVVVPVRKGRVAVVVDSDIFNSLSSEISIYANDLAASGYTVSIINFSGDAIYLKNQLVNLYNQTESLVGAVFVGQIPHVIYEMYEDWGNGEEYTTFPCDMFFMDMDGVWGDSLNYKNVQAGNGKADTWEGDHRVEIWVSRMKTDRLSKLNSNEVDLLKSYFERNHRMRGNILNDAFTSLAYPDDDWSGMGSGDKDAHALVYDRDLVTMINAPDQTNAQDYQDNRLTAGYQHIHVRSHGWAQGHSYANVNDYVRLDPQTSFWSLFVCSGCDFTYDNNLGLMTVFNDEGQGLLTWGSTKTGGMMWDEGLYSEVGNGECVGEGFIRWFNKRYQWEGAPRWCWGMVLLGDGSLGVAEPDYDFKVTPWSGADFTGMQGSDFAGESKVFNVTNNTNAPINMTIEASANWIEIYPSAGTLGAGQSAEVTVGVSASAQTLAAEFYNGSVVFTNTDTNETFSREFSLKVDAYEMAGYWAFEENSGSRAYDSTAAGNDGDLEGGLSFYNDSVVGKYGDALDFDGEDDYVGLPSLGINSNTVTLSAWIKTDGIQDAWDGVIFNRTSGDAGINFIANNVLSYHWGGSYGWNSGIEIPAGQWVFVAMVVEPDLITMYASNGDIFVSKTRSGSFDKQDFSGTTYIGRDSSDRSFKGSIDEVRIYNYALTEQHIRNLVNGGQAENPTPANEALDVKKPELSWIGPEYISSFDIYIGTSAQEVQQATKADDQYIGSAVDNVFVPQGISAATQYFWRVDCVDGDNVIAGNVWEFTTSVDLAFPINIINPGFELPGTGKISNDFDLIPGWQQVNGANSGVETGGHAGSYRLYALADAGQTYQIVEEQLKAGDKYTLSFYALATGGATAVQAQIYAMDGNAVVALVKDQNWAITGSWLEYTMEFEVDGNASYVGKKFAIAFEGDGGWYGIDDVAMTRKVFDTAPEFVSEILIKANAVEGRDYSDSIAGDANDTEDEALTFTRVSEDASWVILGTDGSLSGIARDADVGENTFTVKVIDSAGLSDQALVKISVENKYTGETGLSDLRDFLDHWLDFGCSCNVADLSGDGRVDLDDFAIFSSNWLMP
ncbi:MAG: carbohydrate binding domain-containing protein [Phycisphaerae bacterium]|nr:carbohydrate binding domain-containing protein [Phycisphaerae bacterium]